MFLRVAACLTERTGDSRGVESRFGVRGIGRVGCGGWWGDSSRERAGMTANPGSEAVDKDPQNAIRLHMVVDGKLSRDLQEGRKWTVEGEER